MNMEHFAVHFTLLRHLLNVFFFFFSNNLMISKRRRTALRINWVSILIDVYIVVIHIVHTHFTGIFCIIATPPESSHSIALLFRMSKSLQIVHTYMRVRLHVVCVFTPTKWTSSLVLSKEMPGLFWLHRLVSSAMA